MASYPPVIGASQAKAHRLNKIYGTATMTAGTVRPVRKLSKGNPNMFKRMIKGLVTWSLREEEPVNEGIMISDREEVRISATGIKFEVYRANGGTIVETRRYNRKTDDNIYELHVITDTQDVGQEIGRIITMEALKS